MRRFAERHGFDDYAALQRWSVTDLDGFWRAVADFYALPLVPVELARGGEDGDPPARLASLQRERAGEPEEPVRERGGGRVADGLDVALVEHHHDGLAAPERSADRLEGAREHGLQVIDADLRRRLVDEHAGDRLPPRRGHPPRLTTTAFWSV